MRSRNSNSIRFRFCSSWHCVLSTPSTAINRLWLLPPRALSTVHIAQRNLTSMHVGDSEVNVGMGVTRIFQNIAVNGRNVMESLRDCAHNCDIQSSKSLLLLHGKLSQCPIPTILLLMNKTDQHDYTRNFVLELLMLNKKKHLDPSQCAHWVNKTALFFIANKPYNIYFQFLTY